MEKPRCSGGKALIRRIPSGPSGPSHVVEESNFHMLSFDLSHMCSVTCTCYYAQIHNTEKDRERERKRGERENTFSLTKRREGGRKKKELILFDPGTI